MTLPLRTTGAVGVALLAGAVVGCSADEAAEPADGFHRVETGWMQVDVPEGWVHTGEVTERWTDSYQDAEGAAATTQLLLAPEFGDTDALVATNSVVATAQVGGFPGFDIVADDGEGADEEEGRREFKRVDFTYDGEDGQEYQGVLWGVADDGDEHVILAQLTGADLDPDLVATIEESIVVVGE
ncbi:hypothetical protein GCM10023216_14630 [Isoptericola chiayiensis]|uniref:Lipoprotein n=1 Tax=Isoptericola chiayiensis TaxID=579446 RepID=A0ABP8YD05_9MICO|nr:hypothetical protein [Isoptericola chiayiensis]NOW02094.1 hypothetical protein [Isoptericola chiayiensis]